MILAVIGFIAVLAIAVVMGCYLERKRHDPSVHGTLKIDTSDPDGPYLFVELNEDVCTLQHQEYITLKVDMSGYISQD